jgi:hypothetical protein
MRARPDNLCAICHTAFLELTPFGRRFKLGAYTLDGGDWKGPPFAVMLQPTTDGPLTKIGLWGAGFLRGRDGRTMRGRFVAADISDKRVISPAVVLYSGSCFRPVSEPAEGREGSCYASS